ncbi:MAG TPA: hypothetical protein VIO61_01685 [Anaerolineaceae bacterium]
MKFRLARLSRFPFYPILLGIYPVIFLWVTNYTDIPVEAVVRTLVYSLVIALLAYLLALVVFRNLSKAALVSGVFLLIFYAYGHIFRLMDNASILGIVIGRHRYLLPICGLILAGGIFLVARPRLNLTGLSRPLNAVAGGLIILVFIQFGLRLNTAALAVRSVAKVAATPRTSPPASTLVPQSPAGRRPPAGRIQPASNVQRDVYYILVDGYSRGDLLRSEFNLDNQAFLDQLKSLGFVIPACAQSNYANTILSMASTLNMNYIDALGYSYEQLVNEDYETMLAPLVKNSQVAQKFKAAGYQVITFKSLYGFIDMPNSDVYYDFEATERPGQTLEALNFQYLFMRTTLLRVGMEWTDAHPEQLSSLPPGVLALISPRDRMFETRNYKQYEQNLYAFESLKNIPALPGRKFVYAHLFTTHQPFTFTASGGFRTDFFDSNAAYRDQVLATNTYLLDAIKIILTKSTVPPIIILQGDHSFSSNPADRHKILNAYYLPRGNKNAVYATITPVNTFRLVFSQYFGERLPLLNDESLLVDKEYQGGYQYVPPSCSTN